MSATELVLHLRTLHPFQQKIRDEARRFNVVSLGRRAGKTALGEDLAVETVLDERAPCGWFAPNYKNLGETWRELVDLLRPVARRVTETDHRIEILGGGSLECWSLDSEGVADSVRGRKYKRVVLDEAASVRSLLGIWQKVIRPTLTDLVGDAWFLSTPKGLNGFWSLYQRGQDPADPDWASWRAPTNVNPHIPRQEIDDTRGDLPERAVAQEIDAEFLAEGAGVFRGVAEACTARPQAVGVPKHTYVFGVDWGQVDDFTVVSVLDVRPDGVEQVCLDRFNKIEFYTQAGRLRILHEKFRPSLIVAEANAQAMMLEQLRAWSLPVWGWTATNATKAAAVEALGLALERRQVALLPDPVQAGELLAYEAEKLPSGLIRYAAPEGLHDDCVSALMLAWLGACSADAGRVQARDFRVVA